MFMQTYSKISEETCFYMFAYVKNFTYWVLGSLKSLC